MTCTVYVWVVYTARMTGVVGSVCSYKRRPMVHYYYTWAFAPCGWQSLLSVLLHLAPAVGAAPISLLTAECLPTPGMVCGAPLWCGTSLVDSNWFHGLLNPHKLLQLVPSGSQCRLHGSYRQTNHCITLTITSHWSLHHHHHLISNFLQYLTWSISFKRQWVHTRDLSSFTNCVHTCHMYTLSRTFGIPWYAFFSYVCVFQFVCLFVCLFVCRWMTKSHMWCGCQGCISPSPTLLLLCKPPAGRMDGLWTAPRCTPV